MKTANFKVVSTFCIGGVVSGWRGVFTNPDNQHQIAVLSFSDVDKNYRLSIPIEGFGGWGITTEYFYHATTIANRELCFSGKVWNRLITIPSALMRGNLI